MARQTDRQKARTSHDEPEDDEDQQTGYDGDRDGDLEILPVPRL